MINTVSKNHIYDKRASIYDGLRSSVFLKNDKDIFLSFSLKKLNKEIETVKINIQRVILKSLETFYNKKFKKRKNFLNYYLKDIISLPNITPNGAVKPKKEIINEYNSFHKSVVTVFKKLGIVENIDKAMHIVIRVKNGLENNRIKKRSYATNKLHSDSWSGMTLDSVAMMMLIGDVKNNTVNCYKPIGFKSNILKKMKKYDDGKNYYRKIKYLSKVKNDELVIFDQLCLHRSFINKNSGPRISVDVGIDWKKKKNSYNFKKKSKRYQVFNKKKWIMLNYGSIQEYKDSIKNNKFIKN